MDIFEGKAAGYDSWFDENPLLLESEAEAIRQVMPEFCNGVEIGVGTGILRPGSASAQAWTLRRIWVPGQSAGVSGSCRVRLRRFRWKMQPMTWL